MGTAKRKTWVEKRNSSREAEVEVLQKSFADIEAGEKMLIPTPQIVDAYIRAIPKGKESTMAQMRIDLAAEYHADKTCPLTSGIFLRIVAEAAHEELAQGKTIIMVTHDLRMCQYVDRVLQMQDGKLFRVYETKKEIMELATATVH